MLVKKATMDILDSRQLSRVEHDRVGAVASFHGFVHPFKSQLLCPSTIGGQTTLQCLELSRFALRTTASTQTHGSTNIVQIDPVAHELPT